VVTVGGCQRPPMAAISAQQAGHRVDTGSSVLGVTMAGGISVLYFWAHTGHAVQINAAAVTALSRIMMSSVLTEPRGQSDYVGSPPKMS